MSFRALERSSLPVNRVTGSPFSVASAWVSDSGNQSRMCDMSLEMSVEDGLVPPRCSWASLSRPTW